MKKKYFLIMLSFLSVDFSVNKNNNKDNNKNYTKKLSNGNEFTIILDEPDYFYYKEYKVPKIFLDFIDLQPLYCVNFTNFIIDNYAITEKINELKAMIYNLAPEQVWDILNNKNYFNIDFITMFNVIYNKNEFILLYKTRLTIEFLIFAFNTKEKTLVYNYTYFNNVKLKQILNNLIDFTEDGFYLLENKFSLLQVEEFRKFLHKYTAHKSINRMSFLNELKGFKHFLDIFLKEKNNISISIIEQVAIMNRFFSVFSDK
jgi:hypothetical protein